MQPARRGALRLVGGEVEPRTYGRAFLRANNRPVVTGPGGIVYYFGPAAGAALVAGAGQLPAVAGAAGAAGAAGSDDDE